MHKSGSIPLITGLPIMALLFFSTPSTALETTASAGIYTKYNTNALKTDDNSGSETQDTALVNIDASQTGTDVDADLNYTASKNHYIQNKYNDETLVEGTTNLEWRVFPYRMTLLANHNLTNSVVDSRDVDTPATRSRREVTSLGPMFLARLSPVDQLSLLIRKGQVRFREFQGNDSDRVDSSLQWTHILGPRKSVFLGTSESDVDFVNENLDGYRQQGFFTGFSVPLLNGIFELSGGANTIRRKDQDDNDGKSVHLRWNKIREDEPFHWNVSYTEDVTDTTIGFSGTDLLPSVVGNEDMNFDVVDILRRQVAIFNFNYQLDEIRSGLNLQLYWHDEDYEKQPRDEQLERIQLRLLQKVSRKLSMEYSIKNDHRRFLIEGNHYNERLYSVSADYQIDQKLKLTAALNHTKRSHPVAIYQYEDAMYRIGMAYTFH